jgi:hypothetical protein
LPAESDLVKRCLDALALRFDDNAVSVDRAVANPARIVKLYGTLTQKGDHCPDTGITATTGTGNRCAIGSSRPICRRS